MRPANDNGLSPPLLTLHSTLSPLSPNSPLYPDGIFTPLWITKHQYRLPSVLISFYNLVSEANTSSLEDNKLKVEINNVRTLISSTNYKTKFVVVLVADGPINHAELEDRLVNIRRGTNLDSRAFYYLPSASSQADIDDFAKVLFATIHPTCIEYYRDLSKHARRKRNRNFVPQPTVQPTQGTSSVLSLPGWNVRYEFKLGIFAETRQELEAASRNFEQAYEGLFHSELLGDTIPAYGTRFNEARMLADVIAIRIIRCLLWSSQSATAVKWWTKHRDRIYDLVERRGRGTENYGWEAWQSTWLKVMADLIERSEVFELAKLQLPPGTTPPVQILPSKLASNIERQLPWEFLHHEGYWLDLVRKHIEARRRHTLSAADKSTLPSNRKVLSDDTYLAPEPDFEHRLLKQNGDSYTRRICTTIEESIKAFKPRDQLRMIDILLFRLAIENHDAENSPATASLLKALWDKGSWRSKGWWTLLFSVGKVLHEVAVATGDHELCLRLVWELAALQRRRDKLSAIQTANPLSSALDLETSLTPLATSFAFASDSGHVGEPIAVQFSLSSFNQALPLGLQICDIKIAFDGGINAILLTQGPNEEAMLSSDGATTITRIALTGADADSRKQGKRLSMASASYSTGTADFASLVGRTQVYNFEVVPREAGPASIASIVVRLQNEPLELTLNAMDLTGSEAVWWEVRNGRSVSRAFGMHRDVTTMTVLPKPPKVEIKLPNFKTTCYTNETLDVQIEVFNGEEVQIDGHIEIRLISPSSDGVSLQWKHDGTAAAVKDEDIREAILPAAAVQRLAAGASEKYAITIVGLTEPIDHELDLRVAYTLLSDPASTLSNQTVVDLQIIRPFEGSAMFMPRSHDGAWPDFFAAPTTASNVPQGLRHTYLVRADVGCFAQETLCIRSLELRARRIVGGATYTASSGRAISARNSATDVLPDAGHPMLPEKTEQFVFDLEMQKLVLGDRSPVAVDFAIHIKWSRSGSEEVNDSTLILPKFLAPMSEPRVLLRACQIEGRSGMYLLTYTIENPSMHFLTFSITMEGGEGLAFSGSKLKNVSLVPISRYDIHYRVYVEKSNSWVRVQLEVLDAFFGQTLKVQPASEGVRIDKQGNIQIWAE